jgi:transposase
VKDISADRFVFVDESGVTTAMTRTHARSKKGSRVLEVIPRNRGGVLTLIGALSQDGLIAMGTVNGGTTTDVYMAWLEQVLIPELKPGQIVVMDNLAAHRSPRVIAALREAKCSALFLPPYSPERNPIELFWGWLKARLRSLKARTRTNLESGILAAMDALPRACVDSWFNASGYGRSS